MTAEQFQKLVCDLAQPNIDCSKLVIHLGSYSSWKDVVTPDCVDGSTGNMTTGGVGTTPIKDASMAGEANMKVLVTACYDWTVAKYLPFLLHDNDGNARYTQRLADGGLLLQTSVVFQTEPYK